MPLDHFLSLVQLSVFKLNFVCVQGEGRQSPETEEREAELINLLSIAIKVPKSESDNSISEMVYRYKQFTKIILSLNKIAFLLDHLRNKKILAYFNNRSDVTSFVIQKNIFSGFVKIT
jgi:hypothetical protein